MRIEKPHELKERYGLGARLVSHIIALLKENIDIPDAVMALERMGLDPELAEPLRWIFDKNEQVSLSALRRLATVLHETGDAQAGVVLTVLLELFSRTNSAQLSAELTAVIGEKASIVSGSSKKLGQFIRLGLVHLSKDVENKI